MFGDFRFTEYCELEGFGIVTAAIVLRSYFGSKSRFAAATVLLRLGLIRRYFGRTRSTSAEPGVLRPNQQLRLVLRQ